MVLFFSHHLFAGLRARQISLDISTKSSVVCSEWISVGHLLRHLALNAVGRVDDGMWCGLVNCWIRYIPSLPEFICVLRLTGRCRQHIQSSSKMWFNDSGSSRNVTIRCGRLSQGSHRVALPITN